MKAAQCLFLSAQVKLGQQGPVKVKLGPEGPVKGKLDKEDVHPVLVKWTKRALPRVCSVRRGGR